MEPADFPWLVFRSRAGSLEAVRQASLISLMPATVPVQLIRRSYLRALRLVERKVACIQLTRRDGLIYLLHRSTLHHLRGAIRIAAPSPSVRTISIHETDSVAAKCVFPSEKPEAPNTDLFSDIIPNRPLLTRFLRNKTLDRIGPFDCFVVSNAILLRGGMFVVDDSQVYSGLWNETVHTETWLAQQFCPSTWFSSDPPLLPGLSLALVGPWCRNYYHWLLQQLPRLVIASKRVSLDSIDNILVPAPLYSYHRETLALFRSLKARIITLEPDSLIKAERLVLTTIPCENRYIPSFVVDFFRKLDVPRFPRRPILFFGRGGAERRRVLNWHELEALLQSFGAECISCDTLSLAEQAAMAASADVIVAVHGAALANLVFSRPGALVIELIPRNFAYPCYQRLAQAFGLRYVSVFGDEAGPLPFQPLLHDADLRVNCRRLSALLDAELRNKSKGGTD